LRGGTARLAGGGGLAAVLIAVAAGAGMLLRAPLPETVTLVEVPGAARVEALVVLPYPQGQGPLAHYAEHLAWLGALGPEAREADRHSSAWTGPHSVSYAMTGAREDLAEVLATLAGVFDPVDLPEGFAEEERAIILREYDWRMADNPDAQAAEEMEAFLYEGNAIAASVIGTPDQIKALDPAAARALHAATHLPDKARLVVTGDVTARQLARALDAAGWPLPDDEAAAIAPHPFTLGPPAETVVPFPEEPVAPRLVWRRVVALPDPVAFDLLDTRAALLRDILDTNLPGGIAGPLRFDAAIANTFDIQIWPLDEGHVEIAVYATPDRGVTLEELRRAFETTLAAIAAKGIPEATFVRVLDRFADVWPDWSDPESSGRWMSDYATDRATALRQPLGESEVRALQGQLLAADINALLSALAGPGRTAIALIGKEPAP